MRTCLPITIYVLQTLKSQLHHSPPWRDGCSGKLVFYSFLQASEFATSNITWRHAGDRYTVFIEQSKTDPFHCGHTTIRAIGTSICPVRALRLYAEAIAPSQDDALGFKGGRFSPLDRQHVTTTIHCLLQNTRYNHQHYISHSFRSGATTTAAAPGIPDWLIKILGRWRSDAYQVYIHSSPEMLQSVLTLLAPHQHF